MGSPLAVRACLAERLGGGNVVVRQDRFRQRHPRETELRPVPSPRRWRRGGRCTPIGLRRASLSCQWRLRDRRHALFGLKRATRVSASQRPGCRTRWRVRRADRRGGRPAIFQRLLMNYMLYIINCILSLLSVRRALRWVVRPSSGVGRGVPESVRAAVTEASRSDRSTACHASAVASSVRARSAMQKV